MFLFDQYITHMHVHYTRAETRFTLEEIVPAL